MENSNISWTHNTWNPWVGCDKVAPECAKCYIAREIRKQTDWQGGGGPRKPWGEVYLTKTWADPYKWQAELPSDSFKRIFTCSLSDFFHAKVDDRSACPPSAPAALSLALSQHREVARRAGSVRWRDCAWQVVRETPNLVYLILTKRPELIASRLPKDWPDAFPNVWLGTSTGCNMTLSKMDSLREIPVHPKAIRFVSCEPLLEDISQNINLEEFGWMIVGGESGSNPEYLWNPQGDWRAEMRGGAGRRTMQIGWAVALLQKARAAGIPFFFKQVTAARSGAGENALGDVLHEFPNPPFGKWAPMGKELVVPRPVKEVGDEGSGAEITTEVGQ